MLYTTFLVISVLITNLQGSPPACTTYRDCYNQVLSSTNFDCFGFDSCRSSTITSTSLDIDCFGYQSCYGAAINSASLVDCRGLSSCYGANVDATTFVNCWGGYGCYNADINANSYVDCRGYNSCQNADIEATTYVYCRAFQSCYLANINSGDNLLCDAYRSCYQLVDSVVGGDLTCSAEESCLEADVTLNSIDASTATFSGVRSGYDIEIVAGDSSGDKTIIGSGDESLASSHIYSGLYNTMNVEFKGDLSAQDTYIYCELGSTCTVTCYNTACNNTQFICNSESVCSTSYVDTPQVEYEMISLIFSPST